MNGWSYLDNLALFVVAMVTEWQGAGREVCLGVGGQVVKAGVTRAWHYQ